MSRITVHIDGYGAVRVRIPKKRTKSAVTDAVAEAVAQTMQLAHPQGPATTRFHPALGKALTTGEGR